jgi:hypothetical protein
VGEVAAVPQFEIWICVSTQGQKKKKKSAGPAPLRDGNWLQYIPLSPQHPLMHSKWRDGDAQPQHQHLGAGQGLGVTVVILGFGKFVFLLMVLCFQTVERRGKKTKKINLPKNPSFPKFSSNHYGMR